MSFHRIARPAARLAAVVCLAVLLAALAADVGSLAAAERPNVVWILSEDSSVHYFSLYGHSLGETPAIERLAAEGITFDHAFSCSPVCSVARTTLMTGMLAPRVGFQYHRKTKLAELPDGASLLPAYLRKAGYYTTNNAKKDYNVVEGEAWDKSSRKATWRDRPSPRTPFFHMQTTTVSHESSLHFPAAEMKRENALQTPASEVDLAPIFPDTATFRFTHARYYDRIKAADAEVAKVIAKLKEDDLLEDTIVFYFGDHGGVLPRSKGYVYETGLHVPLVVRVGANWRRLAPLAAGQRAEGFVSFIDFAPTVLRLCGVEVPKTMDGRSFLGRGVDAAELNARNETFGHADRFDEKYDLVRSLRKGRFKYIRNYQSFYPDSLQNNYRYRMLAYQQWRTLFHEGKLADQRQRRFFEPRAPEALYDVEADPYETRNLANDPNHAVALADLRDRLTRKVKSLPDLSFFAESHLVEHALPDGVAYGRRHAEQIARLVDTADLALLPWQEAQPRVAAALGASDPWQRYWGLIVCSQFGRQARILSERARSLLQDDNLLVRVRAAEFLALLGEDPAPFLRQVLAESQHPVESLLTLNTLVFLRDGPRQYRFDLRRSDIRQAKDPLVQRRLEYLGVE